MSQGAFERVNRNMPYISTIKLNAAVALACASIFAASVTQVIAQTPAVVLSCDNGQSYSLRARAVSQDGDLVTGYLLHGSKSTHYLRLIPVGYGYRYAGVGIWLDGNREKGILNFGLGRSTACDVDAGS